MWKTPGRFWAQISPFAHILPPKTAEIHCSAVDLVLFRKPQIQSNNDLLNAGGHNENYAIDWKMLLLYIINHFGIAIR
jgi:hypothetical protein